MKASNNLNQLLSRVKTIFSHKAPHEEKTQPTTQQPLNSDQRLRNALAEVEKYFADNFGTASSALTYKEYNNGISLTSDDPTFSTAVVILTCTNGTLNLPDNVILLGYVKTDKGDDYLIEHLGNFIIFLKRLGVKHRIQHLAIAFSKEHYDTPYDVKTADITCIRLY
ncbi:hypothetical protein C5O23_13115 [Duncaniella muris]|uniref:Uncharacterized protein n=1 Tax=Duncaniella muris TaxID=2094150 RepID=A0A2V1IK71_9BACT|nr:hypothetical protein [Duncaniella muris]PWB00327.1 hypothetical protein C5O23_13115 [Duncaniella muris]